MLCNLCKKVRPPHSGEGYDGGHICLFQHHSTFDALLLSAAAGCAMCAAFRPFVKYGQRKRLRQPVFHAPDNDNESVYSEDDRRTLDDPFDDPEVSGDFEKEGLTFTLAEPPMLRTSRTTGYTDEGNEYSWADESLDDRNDLLQERISQTLEREEAEDRAAGLLRQHTHRSDDYEIVQWLCQQDGKMLGPEQLWLSARTLYGSGDELQGHGEVSRVVILSAGSPDTADEGSSFCLNGRMLENKHKLAYEVPSLWKWPVDSLRMRREISGQQISPTFEFFQHRTRVKTLSAPVSSLSIPEDPCSISCWGTMKEWISFCKSHHTGCRSNVNGESPTRLIDVGLLDGSCQPRLRISDLGSRQQYATLSHCWGGKLHGTSVLQIDNLEQLTRGIDVTALPPNFQDAIRITRELNIPYLWIDCLCIIQDSIDDWARESIHMAKYYEMGDVMLSALAASSSSQGMLQRRTVDSDAVEVTLDGNELGFRLALEDVRTIVKPDARSDVRPDITQQPLNSRGWTLQERLFARRIIHFTQQQLVWQCHTRLASEDGQFQIQQDGALADDLQFDLINISRKVVQGKTRAMTPRRVNVRETGWYDLVHAFSRRNLTFVTDVLPALSGIAASVSEVTGARYVAGLWTSQARERLLTCLLWSPGDLDRKPIRRANNGSPSWSWASLVAEIMPDLYEGRLLRNLDTHCNVFSVEATLATANPYGQVRGGTIGLHGYLHAFDHGPLTFAHLRARRIRAHELHEDADSEHASSGASTNQQVALNEDSWRFWAVDEPLPHATHGAREYHALELDHSLDLPDEPHDWASGRFWLLLLGTWSRDGSAKDESDTWQRFMILEEATDPGNRYRRVGLAETEFEQDLLVITEEEGWTLKTIYII